MDFSVGECFLCLVQSYLDTKAAMNGWLIITCLLSPTSIDRIYVEFIKQKHQKP